MMRIIQNNVVILFVVVIVLFMILPIPAALLDILLVLNISLSVVILVVTMSITDALQFSIFPSLLLITTLFRLGMNISSTRLILRDAGYAGQVIAAFSELITAGNVVIGFIIFIVIVLVQLIVITKGAGRPGQGRRFAGPAYH